ncbi:fimbrial biogenesis outer membrane usher domain protein [Escherichia coli 1-182-04_S3_C2]|nr:fimbrial biogenesis outer membrane usher domain protein [Escherichia coli 1-182-04_S3_C2]
MGRNDLLIRTFPSTISHLTMAKARRTTWIFRVFICFAQSQQLMQN